MKHLSKLVFAVLLAALPAFAQDNISQSTGIIGNGRLLGAKTYDGQTTVGVLGIDSSGNTTVQSLSGKTVDFPGNVSVTGTLANTGAVTVGALTVKPGGDANRLHTISASSDTALTYKFGDAGTTATQVMTLSSANADADDDSQLNLCGGGAYAADGSRGACILLPGEEVSGGGDITYMAGASDTHIFKSGSTTIHTIGATGGLTLGSTSTIDGASGQNLDLKANNGNVDIYTGATPTRSARFLSGGDLTLPVAGGTLAIQEATAGAKCMGTVTANGTTAVPVATTCATTGSRIFLTRSSAPSGTAQCWQTNIVNATSFDLDCDGAETGTFDWFILHEAP